jgi:hypothetical protein
LQQVQSRKIFFDEDITHYAALQYSTVQCSKVQYHHEGEHVATTGLNYGSNTNSYTNTNKITFPAASTSQYITSHHITSYHITSHHITFPAASTSHHITSHHTTSHYITFPAASTLHHITSHHITFPAASTSHHITSHHTYRITARVFLQSSMT